jgi:xanthine/CO dehydrogenase XdhC/CoxF family maturation factor
VTAAKRRLALVSAAGPTRTALAEYLETVGFEVHACDELAVPSAFGALVVIHAPDTPSDVLLDETRSWIKITKTQRVIVVTSKPRALKDLVATHGERLFVLPAPAFGWEIVDVLRATEAPRPRGA